MAATPILATICAERLTKFLTRYSRVQTGTLRCSYPVVAVKPKIPPPPPARVPPVERKYSLWQSSEQQQQQQQCKTPLLNRSKGFDQINFAQSRSNALQIREAVLPGVGRARQGPILSNATRRSIADCIGLRTAQSPIELCAQGQPVLGQSVAQTKARYQALANYANSLLNSKSKSKSQIQANF